MSLRPTLRVAAAATLTLGLAVSAIAAGAAARPAARVHALFIETDNATNNSVISYTRASDGTVSYAGTYPTGGRGASADNAVADPLASQDGLALIDNDNELVATNPGSNTVTVFAVDGTSLSVVQRIGSGGQFPSSVAAHGDLVAVLDAGGAGAVTEYRWVNGKLSPIPAQNRSLGLDNTTPPDFVHGAGEVGYTPDGRHLIVTTKASTSSYDVFSVASNGALSASATVTTSNTPVPFAFNFDPAGQLVGVEAADSTLSVYSVNANGSLGSLGDVGDGLKALCWISTAKGYYFGDNAGSATISSFTVNSSGVPSLLAADAAVAHSGTTDSVASPDGDTLYVESGGAGTLDVYAVGSTGTLTTIETIFNVPVAAEGIAAS